MIDLQYAQAQMERMMQLDFGPKGREQRQEVLRLMCQSRTAPICQRAVTTWLDSANPKFPKPGEIYQIIASLNVEHDEAAATAERRKDWENSARFAHSEAGKAEARQGMVELRSLFETRLATVDQRYNTSPAKERERIKGELRGMLAHINAGKSMAAMVGSRAETASISDADGYHGEF